MTHAIFVKHLDRQGRSRPEIIAYDIEDEALAGQLVSSIASSFEEHGTYIDTLTDWYSDSDGLHEIWAQPS